MGKKKAVELARVRHGELDIRELASPPDLAGYEPEALSAGRVIVGHSESGAVHCIERPSEKTRMHRKVGAAIAFLCLENEAPLQHAGTRHVGTPLKAGWHSVVVKRQENADGSWSPVED